MNQPPRPQQDTAAFTTPSRFKPWIMALRPKTLTAAVVPIVVATALVHGEHRDVIWWISSFALLSAIFIQIGTNLANDAIDFSKGADTHTRIGPQRVTQSGLLSSKQVMAGAIACFVVAFCLGIPLVYQGGWPIVTIGLVSLLLGYAYTGGPWPIAYLGLGDLFVILFFGLAAVGGTYLLQTTTITFDALVAGLQVGCLATVLIAVNNLRDAPEDRRVSKLTLAVRFGLRFSRIEIAVMALLPFMLQAYWLSRGFIWASVLPFVTLPLAFKLIGGVFTNDPSPIYNRFLGMGAGLQTLFGLLFAIGLWLQY